MKTITIILFSILLNACGSSKASTNLSETNKNNTQETLNGTFTVSKIEMNSLPQNLTLTFDKNTNKVSGFSGCNNFSGNYTVKGNAISFKNLVSTEKMCLDNKNSVERQMMSALGKTTSFEIKDNSLMLLNGEKELLIANKTTEAKMEQKNVKVVYRSHARGSFQKITLDNKTVSVQKGYDAKPKVKTCSDKEWNELITLVKNTNLKALTKLEAPSKAHQYDGAPMANFTITKGEVVYDLKPFDAGNPHEEAAKLVNKVINIANKGKE